MLSWAQKQRIDFIRRRLRDPGSLTRAAIAAEFGVSAQTATADFQRLEEHFPGLAAYDPSAKAWVPGPSFDKIERQERTAS